MTESAEINWYEKISQVMEKDGYEAPKMGEYNSTALAKVFAYIEVLREKAWMYDELDK